MSWHTTCHNIILNDMTWKCCIMAALSLQVASEFCHERFTWITLEWWSFVIFIVTALLTSCMVQPPSHQGLSFPAIGMESQNESPLYKFVVLDWRSYESFWAWAASTRCVGLAVGPSASLFLYYLSMWQPHFVVWFLLHGSRTRHLHLYLNYTFTIFSIEIKLL